MDHNSNAIEVFKARIWEYYYTYGRSFAWRTTQDPYKILISEIMLQQTQTYRVEKKYELFIQELPTIQALAEASLQTVLTLWQGLGYNRRAQYLHKAAHIITDEYNSTIPQDPAKLVILPGIGKATAASICAFAFNMPTLFIETNIRSVFIDAFFSGQNQIDDTQIMPLIQEALDYTNPREWYYALMDYGVYLKKMGINPSRRSRHHIKQATFTDSDRQIRGAVIRLLLTQSIAIEDLYAHFNNQPQKRLMRIIEKLLVENLIKKKQERLFIP